jgi:hypothetical protein
MQMQSNPQEWLDNEDNRCHEERLNRLKWIIAQYPEIELASFQGGLKSYYLFEEARYCFVYGQYLASILLALPYIENTLASVFHAIGRNDLGQAGMADLLEEARKQGLISDSEFGIFDKVRQIRNPLTHFRKPLHKQTLEHPYEILEQDARLALTATFRIMAKFSALDHNS